MDDPSVATVGGSFGDGKGATFGNIEAEAGALLGVLLELWGIEARPIPNSAVPRSAPINK
jgi:hypothetical protein